MKSWNSWKVEKLKSWKVACKDEKLKSWKVAWKVEKLLEKLKSCFNFSTFQLFKQLFKQLFNYSNFQIFNFSTFKLPRLPSDRRYNDWSGTSWIWPTLDANKSRLTELRTSFQLLEHNNSGRCCQRDNQPNEEEYAQFICTKNRFRS